MASDMSKWDNDMTLYLFTSLTAGSSHIVTATSRIETILRANRIPFTYIDTATNDDARRLYMRRGQGKKFPLLVKEGYFLGVSTTFFHRLGKARATLDAPRTRTKARNYPLRYTLDPNGKILTLALCRRASLKLKSGTSSASFWMRLAMLLSPRPPSLLLP